MNDGQGLSIVAIATAVIGVIINMGLFVRPETLEQKINDKEKTIMNEVDKRFERFHELNCKEHKLDAKERFDELKEMLNGVITKIEVLTKELYKSNRD